MARLTRALTMYRAAHSAMMAAIEVYNKPIVEYREQTFSILFVNAWETFFKARIVQENNNRMESIHSRKANVRRYERDRLTCHFRTIGLAEAMVKAAAPEEVKKTVAGMARIRNQAVHLGVLDQEIRKQVLYFGTAGIQSFSRLASEWFSQRMHIPYLLPLGFVESEDVASSSSSAEQRRLLAFLNDLSKTSGRTGGDFAVSVVTTIDLRPSHEADRTFSVTDDPAAPGMRLAEEDIRRLFPATYRDLVTACECRYSDFKRNTTFYSVKRRLDKDPNGCHERWLDPTTRKGIPKRFYRLDAAFRLFDQSFTIR